VGVGVRDALIDALRAKESLGRPLDEIECLAWLQVIGPSTISDLSRRWGRNRKFVRRLVKKTGESIPGVNTHGSPQGESGVGAPDPPAPAPVPASDFLSLWDTQEPAQATEDTQHFYDDEPSDDPDLDAVDRELQELFR